jgi:hypothetical protein
MTDQKERSAEDWLRERIGAVGEPSPPASDKSEAASAEPPPTASESPPAPVPADDATRAEEPEVLIPKLRPGEIDLLVAPLPYADDRHRFENALRRLPGVRETNGLYLRRGVYRIRVSYLGGGRLSQQLRALKGFRVRILAEDRRAVQVLIEGETPTLA